jgi:PIN domain nuclease of toxin-antitoxin system
VINPHNFLLDTHVFFGFRRNLPCSARKHGNCFPIRVNALYLSAASIWELLLKYQKGKLDLLGKSPVDYLSALVSRFVGVSELPVRFSHVFEAQRLKGIHKDRFDRLLAGVARVEGMPIITSDSAMRQYDVEVIWELGPGRSFPGSVTLN